MNSILDTLILFFITPEGLIVLMSLLTFIECMMIKSIVKDLIAVFRYIKNNALKVLFPAYFPPKEPKGISKKQNIIIREILDIKKISTLAGITINYIKMRKRVS